MDKVALGLLSSLWRKTSRTQGPREQMCKLRPRGTGRRQWFCLPRMPWPALGHPHPAFSKLRIWPLPPGRRYPRLDAPSSIPSTLLSDQLGSKGAGSPQLTPWPEEASQRWGPPGNPLCDLGQYQSFSGGRLTGQREGWCQGGGHANEEGGRWFWNPPGSGKQWAYPPLPAQLPGQIPRPGVAPGERNPAGWDSCAPLLSVRGRCAEGQVGGVWGRPRRASAAGSQGGVPAGPLGLPALQAPFPRLGPGGSCSGVRLGELKPFPVSSNRLDEAAFAIRAFITTITARHRPKLWRQPGRGRVRGRALGPRAARDLGQNKGSSSPKARVILVAAMGQQILPGSQASRLRPRTRTALPQSPTPLALLP